MKRFAWLVVCLVTVAASATVGGQDPSFRYGTKKWPTDKWDPQFPRPGAAKILQTDDVIVWDDVHAPYQNHYHRHIFDAVTVYIEHGPQTIVTPDGKVNTFEWAGQKQKLHPRDWTGHTGYYQSGIGPHAESSVYLGIPRRTIWVELRRTLSPEAVKWSTDPMGKTDAAFPLFEPLPLPVMPTVTATQKKWPSLGMALEAAGAVKIVDNKTVTVWDETLTATQHSLRKHVRNTIGVQVWDGAFKQVNGDGAPEVLSPRAVDQFPERKMPTVFSLPAGTGPYSDIAAEPRYPRRIIWIELKGTEAADCKAWSIDPACR